MVISQARSKKESRGLVYTSGRIKDGRFNSSSSNLKKQELEE